MPSERPSRKQIAYLNYMGVGNAAEFTRAEASQEIERLRQIADGELPASAEAVDAIGHKMRVWGSEKFRLHPKLYAADARERMALFEEDFRRYVRSQIKGASERLTAERITTVIETLTDTDPCWWQHQDRNALFFAQLQISFPGCCDGTTPERAPATASAPGRVATQASIKAPLGATDGPTSRFEFANACEAARNLGISLDGRNLRRGTHSRRRHLDIKSKLNFSKI